MTADFVVGRNRHSSGGGVTGAASSRQQPGLHMFNNVHKSDFEEIQ